ncbi:MAG: T9SS type A sorting domain-containing protein [Flavobacteriaceae bacterium]
MKSKNYFILILVCSFTFSVNAQSNSTENVEVIAPIDFYITLPMRDYPQFNPMDAPAKEYPRGGMLSSSRQQKADFLKMAGESPTQIDPIIQTENQDRNANPPIVNFAGITSSASPPDPTAAVGPNHIVQMTNTGWTVFDKNGVQAAGFPKNLSDPLGSGSGDPIVLYDREADRWLISQFNFGSQFKIAVSTTPDPTGTWVVYSYPSGSNDYPHYGIYGNNYVVTGNFSSSGRFHAFNREKMINGDPTAEMVQLNLPNYSGGTVFQAPQPAHSEGAGIAAGPTPIVWFQDNAWPGVSSDHIKVWNFDVDWANPGGATISTPVEIGISDFDSFIAGTGGDAFANLQQPGTAQRIDALVHVLNYQTHRYDFGTHESIVLNFVVEPVNGSKISGLRWVELRKTGGGDWELYQEGTYVDPVGDESVFMGGIGMDQEGNIGMAYIKTGTTTRPSLYFTGRQDGNTLGVMTVTEELIIEGVTSIVSNSRYGDYCQLTRDPVDDLTFWFTGEYSGQAGGRKTRIASFKISDIVLSVDELDLNNSELIITSSDQNYFDLTLMNKSTNDILRLSVYDMTGKRIVYEQVQKTNSESYKKSIDMSSASAGIYIVEIGNSKTKINKKIIVK